LIEKRKENDKKLKLINKNEEEILKMIENIEGNYFREDNDKLLKK
jgi:hypothetical protein